MIRGGEKGGEKNGSYASSIGIDLGVTYRINKWNKLQRNKLDKKKISHIMPNNVSQLNSSE